VNSTVDLAPNDEQREGSLVISRNKIKLIQKSKSRVNEKEGNEQSQKELPSGNSSINNSMSKLKINK